MASAEQIPVPAIRRLSLYLRQLEAFHLAGKRTVSSRHLGQSLGLSDAQVRKDFGYFGQFGRPGVGYRVPELIEHVRSILGINKKSKVVLVGVGNLGRALLAYRGFAQRGFEIVAAFDEDPSKIGRAILGAPKIPIQPMNELSSIVRLHGVRLGLLAVPASVGQQVALEMVDAGIRGILNFAPVLLKVDPGIAVSAVDLSVHLEQLAFQVGAGT